jgi:hypothetical protein
MLPEVQTKHWHKTSPSPTIFVDDPIVALVRGDGEWGATIGSDVAVAVGLGKLEHNKVDS